MTYFKVNVTFYWHEKNYLTKFGKCLIPIIIVWYTYCTCYTTLAVFPKSEARQVHLLLLGLLFRFLRRVSHHNKQTSADWNWSIRAQWPQRVQSQGCFIIKAHCMFCMADPFISTNGRRLECFSKLIHQIYINLERSLFVFTGVFSFHPPLEGYLEKGFIRRKISY